MDFDLGKIPEVMLSQTLNFLTASELNSFRNISKFIKWVNFEDEDTIAELRTKARFGPNFVAELEVCPHTINQEKLDEPFWEKHNETLWSWGKLV